MFLNTIQCGDVFIHLQEKTNQVCPLCGHTEFTVHQRVFFLSHNPAPNSVHSPIVCVKCANCKNATFFELHDVVSPENLPGADE